MPLVLLLLMMLLKSFESQTSVSDISASVFLFGILPDLVVQLTLQRFLRSNIHMARYCAHASIPNTSSDPGKVNPISNQHMFSFDKQGNGTTEKMQNKCKDASSDSARNVHFYLYLVEMCVRRAEWGLVWVEQYLLRCGGGSALNLGCGHSSFNYLR